MFIWGTPILSKCEGRNFNEKAPSSSTSNSLLEMAFDQREVPFVESPPWISIIVEKACGELTSLSLCYEHHVLLDRPPCIWKYRYLRRTYPATTFPSCIEPHRANTPLRREVVLAGPWWFSPLPWGVLRTAILCCCDLCFRPGDGFVLVLPSIASLPPVVRTRGFLGFYNKPSRPPSRCFKADSHSCVCDYKTVSHSFFNLLERLCGQILVHIPTNRSFSEYSAPLFFNLPGKF